MTTLIHNEINMLLSSSVANGATNRSLTGSSWEIDMNEQLSVPKDAIWDSVYLSVPEASIWYNQHNLSASLGNNVINIDYDDGIAPISMSITLPDGIYTTNELSDSIQNEISNLTTITDLLIISGNSATGRIDIECNYAGVELLFSTSNMASLLGFASVDLPPSTKSQVFSGSLNPQFNSLNHYLIHSDLVTSGLRFNQTFNQTIAQVFIDVSPNEQCLSRLIHPPRSKCHNLIGNHVTKIRCWVTDQNNNLIDTHDEEISFRVKIEWLSPVKGS